jgi:hypothetical protein
MRWRLPHLSDILVADSADLLNVGRALRDSLERVAGQLELVLDVGRGDDLNAGLGSNAAYDLLTKEISVEITKISLRPQILPST